MSLKFTEESCAMAIKNDVKFLEELTSRFKIAMWNWTIFTRAIESLKNYHFNGLLLNKVYNAWAKKVQRSYVSWHWRVMQNLKKTWLVVWKMKWEIWQIFTRALDSLKIGTLMGSFYPKLKRYELNANLGGLFRGSFWGGGEGGKLKPSLSKSR